MFGSLVVVLPTAHEGGTLIFRHGDEEWKFESDAVPPSSITYAAFYGDVEHEVAEVRSGYRLTLTYNLYFGDSLDSQAIVSTPTARTAALFTTLPPNAESFQSKLAELLADDTFLPQGGHLGFGLSHEYPFKSDPDLKSLTEVLKGSDATIMQACRAFGLGCVLRICYEGGNRALALCTSVPDLDDGFIDEDLFDYLKGCRGVTLANRDSDNDKHTSIGEEIDLDNYDNRGKFESARDRTPLNVFVHWVTKQSAHNAFKTQFVAYGNEPSMGHGYGRVCLIVSVGPPGRRGDKPLRI